MTLRNDKNGDRIDCKHLAVMLLLSFGLVLSFSLITAAPGLAQDGCTGGVANGAGEWYFPGSFGLPAFYGRAVFHLKECYHNQPAKGWLYNSYESGLWTLYSVSAVKIVFDTWDVFMMDGSVEEVEGKAAWVLCQVVATNDPIFEVGMWAYGAALDAGTPGRNGDMLFVLTEEEYWVDQLGPDFASYYYDLGIGGFQLFPFWAIVVRGNVRVK